MYKLNALMKFMIWLLSHKVDLGQCSFPASWFRLVFDLWFSKCLNLFKSLIYDLLVGLQLSFYVAKSIWVNVDFAHHASCNANQPSTIESNLDPAKANLSNSNLQPTFSCCNQCVKKAKIWTKTNPIFFGNHLNQTLF